MNDPSAHVRRSERRSGRRPSESSPHLSRHATWQDVDRELEVRSRLACLIDSLDAGDVETAALNVQLLLEDLDEAAA